MTTSVLRPASPPEGATVVTAEADPAIPVGTDSTETLRQLPLFVWMFVGSLVLNIFSGHWEHFKMPIGPDRLLFAGAIVLLLVDHRRPKRAWKPVFWVMIALVVWTFYSMVFHDMQSDTNALFALLDRIAVPFLFFAVGPLIFTTQVRRDLLLKAMTVTALYCALIAVVQIVGPQSLVWPRYILDLTTGDFVSRALGPFGNPEALGNTLAISIVMAGVLYARSEGRKVWRFIALATIPLSVLGIVLTQTRSVWAGAGIGLIVIFLAVPKLRMWIPGLVIAAAMAVVGLLVAMPALQTSLLDRLNDDRSIADRLNTNNAALSIIDANPVTGIGWARFLEVGTQWVRQAENYPITTVDIEVHNVFLSRAAETGVLGAALWIIAALMGPLAALWPRPRTDEHGMWWLILIAAVCCWGVTSMTSPNPYPLPNNLMWLVGGIVGAPAIFRFTRADSVRRQWLWRPVRRGSTSG